MDVLDAIRGVAVFGILIVNIFAFSGYAFISEAEKAALPMSRSDGIVDFLVRFLAEGKFYCLFSFLFGVGFSVFIQRASSRGSDAVGLFKRR
jgi:uncharacterized protein